MSNQTIKEIEIEPSERVKKSICDSQKFCSAQGPITFGQLKAIVEAAMSKRVRLHIGEGGYKAFLRLLPWFVPQVAVAGFIGAAIRAANKILKPALTETTNYKSWWGKTILRIFDIAEGELNPVDPFSKIFFVSDGLLRMLDEENKVKFARYISQVASEKPDDEMVPEYFVENELRKWVNERFLLDPPLDPKSIQESTSSIDLRATQILNSFIKKLIPDDSTFETWFTQPWENERTDVFIEYRFNDKKTKFSKLVNDYGETEYIGTVYLDITNLLVGQEDIDSWEKMFSLYDVPDYVWEDEFEPRIYKMLNSISKSFNIHFDIDEDIIKEKK